METKPKHAHAAMIDKLGGKMVSGVYGLKRANLYTWRTRGVPHAYRVSFARLASLNGVAVPSDFFKGMQGL